MIDVNEDADYVEVTFKEDQTDEGGTDLLDSRYRFRDYEAPGYLDHCCTDEIKGILKCGFFDYLLTRFGIDYMEDFMLDKTNVKVNFPPYLRLTPVNEGRMP